MSEKAPSEVKRLHEPEDLRRIIAKSRRVDLIFGIVGAILILGALSTLGVLVGKLVQDGAGRLFVRHEVKESGQTAGFRDLNGKLVKGSAGSSYLLAIDPVPADLSATDNLPPDLEGKRVISTGLLPSPGEGQLSVEGVKVLGPEASLPERLGRNDFVGTFKKAGSHSQGTGSGWVFAPEPVELNISKVEGKIGALTDQRVAASGRRGKTDRQFVIEDVERLVSQGFLTAMPSSSASRAGVFSAWVGTLLVMLVTVCTALPLGICAGIYLEEYARRNWITHLIEINIANLAGVPSIIWGLMALGLLIYGLNMGHSIATAGVTLGLLVLPIVIIATREAIRSIPATIRDASIALGATKWQTVQHHILPYSMGGILTGTIVAISRAIGETAPLITIGALTYVTFLPNSPFRSSPPFVSFDWLNSPFTVLPIQMFNWLSRPEAEFHNNAAAAGLLLIGITLSLNAFAIVLRYRLRKNIKW